MPSSDAHGGPHTPARDPDGVFPKVSAVVGDEVIEANIELIDEGLFDMGAFAMSEASPGRSSKRVSATEGGHGEFVEKVKCVNESGGGACSW